MIYNLKSIIWVVLLFTFTQCNSSQALDNIVRINGEQVEEITNFPSKINIRNNFKYQEQDSIIDSFISGASLKGDSLNKVLVFYAYPDSIPPKDWEECFKRFNEKETEGFTKGFFSETSWYCGNPIKYYLVRFPERDSPNSEKDTVFYQEIKYKLFGDSLYTILTQYTDTEKRRIIENQVKINLQKSGTHANIIEVPSTLTSGERKIYCIVRTRPCLTK